MKRKTTAGIFIFIIVLVLPWIASADGSAVPPAMPLANGTPYKLYLPLIMQPDLGPPNLEITQAVQEPGNAVALVAGRTTFVRYTLTSTTPHADVRAYLYGYRDGSPLPGSPIEAMNNPRTLEAAADRDVLGDSFNFYLPPEWTSGEVTLSGSASNDSGYSHYSGSQVFSFLEGDSLDVTIVPIAYTCTSGGSGTRTPAAPYDYLVDFTYRVYPVPGVNSSLHAPLSYSGPCTSDVPNPTYSAGLPYDDSDWERMLQLVTTTWQSEGRPDSYYYGLVDVYCGGGCIAGLGWIGGSKAAVGFSGIGASHAYASDTHAHEVGHNHGLKHAPGCGASGLDPGFPYPTGKIGDAGHPNQGFDLITPSLKLYTTYYDMMSYCDPVWISDYNYERLRLVHAAPDVQIPAASGESLIVSGAVSGDEAVIYPAFTLDLPAAPPAPGPYRLELLDAYGTVLRGYPFAPAEAHADPTEGPSPGSIYGFHLTLPAEPGVAAMRVTRAGETLASIEAQALAPDRAGGAASMEGRLLLVPADVPVLVRASTDGGETWQTIAYGARGAGEGIDLAPFKGKTVRLEVHVSNGVGSRSVAIGPVQIP
jgi:hypothetical protein